MRKMPSSDRRSSSFEPVPAGWSRPKNGRSRGAGLRRVISFVAEATAAASRLLVRRAHLETAVTVGVARLGSLPAARDSFTHAWSVEALHPEEQKRPVFDELFRVVRPGGHVALQEWVLATNAPALAKAWYEPAEVYVAGLRGAGFVDGRVSGAGDLREEESTITEIVWERVSELLGGARAADRGPLTEAAVTLDERSQAARDGRLSLVQIFARKPS